LHNIHAPCGTREMPLIGGGHEMLKLFEFQMTPGFALIEFSA
jgi:hypothetical protein